MRRVTLPIVCFISFVLSASGQTRFWPGRTPLAGNPGPHARQVGHTRPGAALAPRHRMPSRAHAGLAGLNHINDATPPHPPRRQPG